MLAPLSTGDGPAGGDRRRELRALGAAAGPEEALDVVDLRGVATASAPSAPADGRPASASATPPPTGVRWSTTTPSTPSSIATRHDLHAGMAAAALRAGKAVFLEKPMALNAAELDDVLDAWRASGRVAAARLQPSLRANVPAAQGQLRRPTGPLVMAYRVNAGAVAPTSWVVDPVQGGGRLVGEVCHMLDLLVDLAGARGDLGLRRRLRLGATGDDVRADAAFDDGSIGTIVYASGGDRSLPKEQLEVLGGGRSAVLDDFRTLRLYAGGSGAACGGRFATQDKGHAAELAAFLEAVRQAGRRPSTRAWPRT